MQHMKNVQDSNATSVNVLQCREDSEESESFNADGPRAGTYDACTANLCAKLVLICSD